MNTAALKLIFAVILIFPAFAAPIANKTSMLFTTSIPLLNTFKTITATLLTKDRVLPIFSKFFVPNMYTNLKGNLSAIEVETIVPTDLPEPMLGSDFRDTEYEDEEHDTPDTSTLPLDRKSACFPADAVVTKADGSKMKMKDLRAGESLRVSSDGSYSTVFAFTHRDHWTTSRFIQIKLCNGKMLTMSPGHYGYVNGRVLTADSITTGDSMQTGSGHTLVVNETKVVFRTGLYAPHTMHGDLVVNDIIVSSYTRTVDLNMAHAMLAPR